MVPSKLESLYKTNDIPGKHPDDQAEHLAREASSSKSHTTPTPARAGPAIRAFEKKVRQSSGAQAAAERNVSAKKPSPIRTVTHVEIPKRGRGRPAKSSLISDISPMPDTPIESSLGKRKPSASSQPYSPPKSSIKKVLRDAKRQKVAPSKTVGFVEAPAALEEDSEDLNYPASPIKRPVRAATAGVSKATVAGKQARKKRTTEVADEPITAEEYAQAMRKGKEFMKVAEVFKKGTTRSGTNFAV
jgi:hypothetical protein